MRWNDAQNNNGYCLSHVTDDDVDKLYGIVQGVSWHDCQAVLKNRMEAILFSQKVPIDQLLSDIANGEYGELEGAHNAYAARHFDGNMISLGK